MSKVRSRPSAGPFIESIIIPKQLKIEGFMVFRWGNRWQEGLSQMAEWMSQVGYQSPFLAASYTVSPAVSNA